MMCEWLKYPLNQLKLIQERLDAVEYIIDDSDYWAEEFDIKSRLQVLLI